MKKHRLLTFILTLLICFLTPVSVEGSTTYRSLKLKQLVSALRLNADTLRDGETVFTINNRQVKVSVANHTVTAVGYHLFSDELKALARTPILDFLERYFLQMDYPVADRPTDRMLREDRFKFEKGSRATVATLRSDDAFSYNYELRRYVATWTRNGQPLLVVSFPADHELISGENKIESENNIEGHIRSAHVGSSKAVSEGLLSPTVQKDYYIRKGGTYLNDMLSSTLYYQQHAGAYHLLSDVSHPLESAANLMLNTDVAADCQLKIKQVMYGYKKKFFEVSLRNWIAYCQNSGCELYYGVESFTDNLIKASVIAVNTAENYNHVLFVNIPLSVIENKAGVIEAQLETFIPMHNVRNLFDKYHKTKNKERKMYE